jgi:hypothetical protein
MNFRNETTLIQKIIIQATIYAILAALFIMSAVGVVGAWKLIVLVMSM